MASQGVSPAHAGPSSGAAGPFSALSSTGGCSTSAGRASNGATNVSAFCTSVGHWVRLRGPLGSGFPGWASTGRRQADSVGGAVSVSHRPKVSPQVCDPLTRGPTSRGSLSASLA